MIYFSELKGKKVITEDKVDVGVLDDLIFNASERPNITKLVVKDTKNNNLLIPATYLRKLDKSILLKKEYQTAPLEENELFILKNLQDKQIIDIQNNKIVRVNDITIQDKDGFFIVGVDIGIIGILRWLKLEYLFNKIALKVNYKLFSNSLSWADIQPLELARGQVKLKKEEKKLEKMHPEDLADYLEKTNLKNINKILNILEEKFAAEVISKLNINLQTALFRQISPEKAVQIISVIDPDDAVDVLLTLSERRRNTVIDLLASKKRLEIKHLLNLSNTPIGGLINTEYLTVYPNTIVKEILTRIKKETEDFSFFYHIYVINLQNELIGVIDVHELLLHDPETPVYRFMIQNVVAVHLTTPGQIALKKLLKYKIAALPVIDRNRQLLGIITIVDVVKAFSLS